MFIRKFLFGKTYENNRHHRVRGMVSALMLPMTILAIFVGLAYALQTKPAQNILKQNENIFSDNQQITGNENNNDNQQATTDSSSRPNHIKIEAIKVNAPIVNLGLNKDGTVQVPSNPLAVGWYAKSVYPGQTGPAVMIGHLDSSNGPAIFWNLNKLQPGDKIEVTRADGTTAVFKVDSKESVSQTAFPTNKVYGATAKPTLRLITCSGKWLWNQGHYSNNLVIYASLIEQYANK